MPKKIAVLYHANCKDGLGAAYSAKKALGDKADYRPVSYGDNIQAEEFTGKQVYLLDFSFKRKLYMETLLVSECLVVLDHHKTAHEEIGDLVNIDQTKSGAVLAWEYFHPGKEIPKVLLYIQDRDLWSWSMVGTGEVSAFLDCFSESLEKFEEAMLYTVEDMIRIGKIMVTAKQAQVRQLAKKARLIEFMGHEVLCCNCTSDVTSELGNELAKGRPFSVVYRHHGDHKTVSLRSTDEGEDVSVLAKALGGGGHRNAAGCVYNLYSAEHRSVWKELM